MHGMRRSLAEVFTIVSLGTVPATAFAGLRGPGLAGCRRLVDALSDPARRMRAVFLLALVYALVWTLDAVVSKSSQGMNADMAEMLVWVREPALGYPKHPPFLAWELTLWFAIFPLTDWAYYLLSGVNLGVGLIAAFVLAGEWLEGAKRAAVPFLLAVIPFYNFFGLKFDQNSALIPLWAFTIFAFVRSYRTHDKGYAALAGLFAAAAMLSKYWSAFLLVALGLAALFDRRRNAYFRSPAPYVTALVAAAAFAPHFYWLVREHFPPMAWVTLRRTSQSLAEALGSLAEYTFGTLGYAGLAIILVLVVVRPSWRALRDGMVPSGNERRMAAIAFWAPLIVPVLIAFVTHTNLLSLWNTPSLNLLPVILLGSPLVLVSREQVTRIAAVAVALALAALVVSPLVALAQFRLGVENDAAYTSDVAAALEREWKRATAQPLRLVGGPFELVNSVVMYVPERPSTYSDFSSYLSPWVTQERIAREGIALVCPSDYGGCIDRLDKRAAGHGGGRRSEVELTPHWLGIAGAPLRFTLAIIPPGT